MFAFEKLSRMAFQLFVVKYTGKRLSSLVCQLCSEEASGSLELFEIEKSAKIIHSSRCSDSVYSSVCKSESEYSCKPSSLSCQSGTWLWAYSDCKNVSH